MAFHLSLDASIVHNKGFEGAVVKILGGNEAQINPSERAASKHLETDSQDNNTSAGDDALSYFEKMDAKRHTMTSSATKYLDCQFKPATSCSVERLFSAAK